MPELMIRIHRSVLLLFFFLILAAACGPRKGSLRPLRTRVATGDQIIDQPVLVAFSELQADSQRFRDRLVRVSGNFAVPDQPGCEPYSGPQPRWALVAENLRLDILGLETVARLASNELSLTIDGYFRQYEGPLGCGKEPAPGAIWYMEVVRVVQPASIVRALTVRLTPDFPPVIPGEDSEMEEAIFESSTGTPSESMTTPTPVLTATQTPNASPEEQPTSQTTQLTPTEDSILLLTQTPSPGPGTPGLTPTATPTLGPGTPSATPTVTPLPPATTIPQQTASPTPVPNNTSQPLPSATATVSDYPPPLPSIAPTATSVYP